MLQFDYHIKINKQNSKFIKNTQLLVVYLLKNLINTNPNLHLKKINSTVKTLLLSPFHYKVAKKNLSVPTQFVYLKGTQVFLKENESLFIIDNYNDILDILNLN